MAGQWPSWQPGESVITASMYAAILIPDFELQCALRGEPGSRDAPSALIGESESGTPLLVQINFAAQTQGVEAGMSLPQAQARSPTILFQRRNMQQEAVATAALLQSADPISPYLEHTSPGCCTLDLSRNGEIDHEAWAHDLVAELRALDLEARIGIAALPDAAMQAAQLAKPVLVTADSLQTVSQLPVMALNPSEQILNVLYDWGIHQIGEFRSLQRQQVAERLGVEGLALWDRAGGGAGRPLRYIRPTETYEEPVEFDACVETLEPILFRLRRCIEQLCKRVRADCLLIGGIELSLHLDDGNNLTHKISIPSPTCEIDMLFRLLSGYLDTVTTVSPIKGFRLQALPNGARDHQAHLWEASLRDPNAFSETLAQLGSIVGSDRVGTPYRLPTHRPDSFRLQEPRFEGSQPEPGKSRQAYLFDSAESSALLLGLCLRRYRPPFRLTVKSEAGNPLHINGRDLNGDIRASNGPWRLSGNWWDENSAWRWEEWDVELSAGGVYRLANHRQANWWMLGIYD